MYSLLDAKCPCLSCMTCLCLALSLMWFPAPYWIDRFHFPPPTSSTNAVMRALQAVDSLNQLVFCSCNTLVHRLTCLSYPWTWHLLWCLLSSAGQLHGHEHGNYLWAPCENRATPASQICQICVRSHTPRKASCLDILLHLKFARVACCSSRPKSKLKDSPDWRCSYRSLVQTLPLKLNL